jgi:hypothetical protein
MVDGPGVTWAATRAGRTEDPRPKAKIAIVATIPFSDYNLLSSVSLSKSKSKYQRKGEVG